MLTRKAHIIPDRLSTEEGVPYNERLVPLVKRYQFADLEVGQSFQIPYRPGTDNRMQRKLQQYIGAMICDAHRMLPARRFSQRSNRDGVRIWRIR